MKRVVLVLLLLGVPTVTRSQENPFRVQSITLKNGLQVLLAPDSLATAADVSVCYRAGTRHEPAGASGLSHLLGRLMFRGSERFADGEHARLLQAQGASWNSVANPDYSCFYQTLPPDSIELALRLEADRMAGLDLTPAKLDAARRAVLDERRRRLESSPIGHGLQLLYEKAFGDHPYARPAIGTEGDLTRISLDDVRRFHRERFSPHNAVLTVVGRFDPMATLRVIRRWYEPLPRRVAPSAVAPKLPEQRRELRASERLDLEAPILLVGWRCPGETDPDSPALELLAHVISSGPSSLLSRELAARGQIARTEADFDRSRDASLLVVFVVLRPDADRSELENAVITAIEGLADAPLPADRLDRAKRRLEIARLFEWQTMRGRAQTLAAAQMLAGKADPWTGRLERIRGLSGEDLQTVAARVLQASNRTVVWLGPGKGAEEEQP